MTHFIEQFLMAWIPLFVAMDPVGLVPMFLAMTRDLPPERVRSITWQAVITAGVVAVAFMFGGKLVFQALGITVSDFEIAGGLILLAIAGREMITTRSATMLAADDIGVVPLGVPLITGPATLAALLLLMQTLGVAITLAAFACNLLLTFLALRFGNGLKRLVGTMGLKAFSKVIALLLAAIAVHMIRRGLAAAS
ncbi:MAG: MarC family protein [Kiritimatiellaeota bacterium]|nr:MarC family protein [Kiritimatiellota bacterium]